LKEEALDRTLWRTRLGRVYGLVVTQTTLWMNDTPVDALLHKSVARTHIQRRHAMGRKLKPYRFSLNSNVSYTTVSDHLKVRLRHKDMESTKL
jgi:hypothetical protein